MAPEEQRTWYQCTACGQVSETPLETCPNCGGVGSFKEREGELQPDRLSADQLRDGSRRERTPEEIRQEVAANAAEKGGVPQRPIP
jgi:predicted ATP-dependent serine protease